jgi:hypothetical protein
MPSPAEYEPIGDDEILYRRVPVSMKWVNQQDVKPEAFQPRKEDTTGLSVSRQRFLTVEQAAQGTSKQGYWVLELRAGDMRKAGIDVQPRPIDDVPGHSEIPSLTYQDPQPDASMAQQMRLAKELVIKIHGPFPAKK